MVIFLVYSQLDPKANLNLTLIFNPNPNSTRFSNLNLNSDFGNEITRRHVDLGRVDYQPFISLF